MPGLPIHLLLMILREIAQICDAHAIKSYLTINTIIYDEDIALMRTIVEAQKKPESVL